MTVSSHVHSMFKPSLPDIIDFESLNVEGAKELQSFGDVQASLQR